MSPMFLPSWKRGAKSTLAKNHWPTKLATVAVQSLSHVWFFATPWTAACQTPLSSTISWSLLRFRFTESLILSNHFILCCRFSSCLQSFPASGSFPVSWLFTSAVQNIGASASASVVPMSIEGWFPVGLTGLIFLLSKGLSRVFSATILKHQFFDEQASFKFMAGVTVCSDSVAHEYKICHCFHFIPF